MQDTLNKMVASVRYGVLGPDDASRSIHECAALLGLELATEIPVTTLIISGMRKTAEANDLVGAFQEFGEIAEAAVSSNQRGFGKFNGSMYHENSACYYRSVTDDFCYITRNSAIQNGQIRFPRLTKIQNGGNRGSGCCCSGEAFEAGEYDQWSRRRWSLVVGSQPFESNHLIVLQHSERLSKLLSHKLNINRMRLFIRCKRCMYF